MGNYFINYKVYTKCNISFSLVNWKPYFANLTFAFQLNTF